MSAAVPRHPETPRLRPSIRPSRQCAGLVRSETGHVFLLAGLLLAMGTVALGGVFVAMEAVDDQGTREQKGNLMEPVSALVAGFNESVRGMVPIGETDIDTFKDRVADLERRVYAQAAADGVYLSLDLVAQPDPSVWQRPSRCASYDPDRSRDGVVIGYDFGTKQESIVGAVFDLHATDGRQVVRFPYYLKVTDCLPTQLTTWFTGIRVVDGFVLNPENAKGVNDNNAVMTVGELPQGQITITEHLTFADGSLSHNGWENERYFEFDDQSSSHHPATPLSDYLLFGVDTSTMPPDAVATNVRVRADVWHVDVTDDYLQLRAIYNDIALYTWMVPTTETEQTLYYDLPLSPSGNLYWTAAELDALRLEFQVIEVGHFDPPSFFHVEFVDVEYSYTAPEKYAFTATIDWPVVPELYDLHFVELRYRYTASTPGESFLLQVHSGGVWNTRADLVPTAGAWSEVAVQVQPVEIEGGIIEMRLIDSISDDRWSTDGDQIEFDYIYLWSEVDDGTP